MTDLEQAQSIIPALPDADIAALETAINRERAARIAARDAGLPAYPWVILLDKPEQGHKAGTITQVTKPNAIQLLGGGSHRLATPEEISAYTGERK